MLAKLKIALVVAGGVALSGCMKVEDYPQQLNQGVASLSAKKGFNKDRLIETQPKQLRTFVATGEDGKGLKEVRDANCVISSPELHAKARSPQVVATPVIKGKPGTMTITCKRGDQKGQVTLPPNFEYRSTQVTGTGSSQAAVAGLLITLAVNAAAHSKAKKQDEWQYFQTSQSEIRVKLK